jgi:hypothetical protein
MSTNMTPGGAHPLQGSPQAQVEFGWASAQQAAKEREVKPSGDSPMSQQKIPVPQLAEGYKPVSVSSLLGHEADVVDANTHIGFGPRLVILDHYVTGPAPTTDGGDRAAFARGDVVWASQLFGAEITQKAIDGDEGARSTIRRYFTQNALREATKDEGQFTKISFIEGEEAMAQEVQATQARVANLQDENERMKELLNAINISPDMSPEDLRRRLAQQRQQGAKGQQAQGQQQQPSTPPNVQKPTTQQQAGAGQQQPETPVPQGQQGGGTDSTDF